MSTLVLNVGFTVKEIFKTRNLKNIGFKQFLKLLSPLKVNNLDLLKNKCRKNKKNNYQSGIPRY